MALYGEDFIFKIYDDEYSTYKSDWESANDAPITTALKGIGFTDNEIADIEARQPNKDIAYKMVAYTLSVYKPYSSVDEIREILDGYGYDTDDVDAVVDGIWEKHEEGFYKDYSGKADKELSAKDIIANAIDDLEILMDAFSQAIEDGVKISIDSLDFEQMKIDHERLCDLHNDMREDDFANAFVQLYTQYPVEAPSCHGEIYTDRNGNTITIDGKGGAFVNGIPVPPQTIVYDPNDPTKPMYVPQRATENEKQSFYETAKNMSVFSKTDVFKESYKTAVAKEMTD